MALVICSECGQKVSDKAKVCPQCGAPIEATVSDEFGTLHVQWKGKWMLIDSTVDLLVNGKLIGKYSFKKGFDVDVPILSANVEVVVRGRFNTAKHTFIFEPQKDYTCDLVYSRFTGGFGFKAADEEGNITSDKLPLFISILAFLSPLFGVIYGFFVKKDKPTAYKTAIFTAICGFLFGFIYLLGLIYIDAMEIPFFYALIGSIGFGGVIGIVLMISPLIINISNSL